MQPVQSAKPSLSLLSDTRTTNLTKCKKLKMHDRPASHTASTHQPLSRLHLHRQSSHPARTHAKYVSDRTARRFNQSHAHFVTNSIVVSAVDSTGGSHNHLNTHRVQYAKYATSAVHIRLRSSKKKNSYERTMCSSRRPLTSSLTDHTDCSVCVMPMVHRTESSNMNVTMWLHRLTTSVMKWRKPQLKAPH